MRFLLSGREFDLTGEVHPDLPGWGLDAPGRTSIQHPSTQTMPNGRKESTTMFNEHTIYLTDDQEARARSGEMKRAEALAVITETLPPEINLEPGDIVRFNGDPKYDYEIVRLEGDEMLIRRLVGNSAGPAGEVVRATVAEYVDKIRSGKAEVLA